jgi:mono/diheme cytochrome c family protein
MRFLAAIGALAIIFAIAAAVFFFGGFLNVAASEPELAPVAWALQHVREASIDRHAKDNPTISLEDATVVQAGAKAFAARGCANCHGAPGVAWAKFSEGLRPDPPDLKDVAGELEPREIFYVIKNGINMTGMPSFGAIEVGDSEIWQIAAFVKKLPTVSEADYKSWTEAPATAPAEAPAAAPAPAPADKK